jgi:hypothetical protein
MMDHHHRHHLANYQKLCRQVQQLQVPVQYLLTQLPLPHQQHLLTQQHHHLEQLVDLTHTSDIAAPGPTQEQEMHFSQIGRDFL